MNLAAGPFAVDCKTAPERIADLVRESLAPNTRAAYLADLAHFENWGGQIPAEPETIAAYIATYADALSVATLNRRLAALAKVHRSHGMANPTSSELVKSVLRGLKRLKGTAQRQATPLLKDDLILALDATGEGLRDVRDRALLLIGFAGGFRRSELVALNCGDAERVRQGIILTLRRSKTDQTREGRKIGIPLARGRWCPVGALEQWLATSGIVEGALFRPIDRHSGRSRANRFGSWDVRTMFRRIRSVASDDRRPIQNPQSRRPRCWSVTTTDLGTVVGASWSGVTINWDDGHTTSIQHNDMAQVERVPTN